MSAKNIFTKSLELAIENANKLRKENKLPMLTPDEHKLLAKSILDEHALVGPKWEKMSPQTVSDYNKLYDERLALMRGDNLPKMDAVDKLSAFTEDNGIFEALTPAEEAQMRKMLADSKAGVNGGKIDFTKFTTLFKKAMGRNAEGAISNPNSLIEKMAENSPKNLKINNFNNTYQIPALSSRTNAQAIVQKALATAKADPATQQDVHDKTAQVLQTMSTEGPAAAQAVLSAHVPSLQDHMAAEISKQDPSMFEALGKKALPYAAPVLQRVAPALQNPIVHNALSVLGKPQEYATRLADKAVGGTGDAQSFADVAARINQKLPASLQNEGLAKDIGYVADMAFPIPLPRLGKLEGVLAHAAPKAKAAAKEADLIQKMAGLGEKYATRELPLARQVLEGVTVPTKDVLPGTTAVIKSSAPLENPKLITQGARISNEVPGVKIISSTPPEQLAMNKISTVAAGKDTLDFGPMVSKKKQEAVLKILEDLQNKVKP